MSKKVVIPEFVADWMLNNNDPIFEICAWAEHYYDSRQCDDLNLKLVLEWYQENTNEFYQAVVNGYEIEQPQKYYWRVKSEHLVTFSGYNGWLYLNLYQKDNEIELDTKNETLFKKTLFTIQEASELLNDDFDKFEKEEIEK